MIAELGERCAVQRLWDLPAPSMSGAGWYAVRSGAASNDLNGVVSDGEIPEEDWRRLLAWLSDVPACWHTTRPDPALTATLLAAGATPERTGHWCGRELPADPTDPAYPVPRGVERADDPVRWSSVLDRCGWYDGDVSVRQALLVEQVAAEGWAHWWVLEDGDPVAVLSAWCRDVLEVVDVAVLPAHRRRGLGRSLVLTALSWARQRGATTVVAAPSPDGAELLGSLGFGFEPVTPDVCFYL